MSEYTTQLRYICEQYAGRTMSANYSETPAVIAAALPKLFDFDFPLYDPAYKKTLETKIVHHYYFREIGAETAAQFKFMLARTLNEIMPYYNGLYKSADLQFNPFYDVDYFRDHKGSDTEKRLKNDNTESTTTSAENGNISNTTQFTGTSETNTTGNRTTNIENETVRTLNLEDERTLNTQNQTTYNSTDTKTLNTTDTTTLNTTDTKTLNTKDTVRNSDTPQGALNGIENNNYLSSATITDKTGTEKLDKTGTEALAKTGTETGKKTGTDTTAQTGTDTTAHTGTDSTAIDETQTATESSNTSQETTSTTTETGSSSKTSGGSGRTSSSGTEDINGTDQYLDHIYGKMGSTPYAELLRDYRETLLNIDMMIIDELEVCFMNLY